MPSVIIANYDVGGYVHGDTRNYGALLKPS